MWTPLKKYNLVRTPQEEQVYLLQNAKDTDITINTFSEGIIRGLKAALILDKITQDLDLVFKSGAGGELDILLQDSDILVNDRWLGFHASHKDASCWLSRIAAREDLNIESFFCDHVVIYLYDLILIEVAKASKLSSSGRAHRETLSLKIAESLCQMPREVDIRPVDQRCQIQVSWTDLDGHFASIRSLELTYSVVLHRERTCAEKKDALLNHGTDCRCPQKVVPQNQSRVSFVDLDSEEEYFPMVSRNEDCAFFGIRPKSI